MDFQQDAKTAGCELVLKEWLLLGRYNLFNVYDSSVMDQMDLVDTTEAFIKMTCRIIATLLQGKTEGEITQKYMDVTANIIDKI